MDNKETFGHILEYVNLNRAKNKLLRETAENDLKIHSYQSRITLIDNINEYLADDLTIDNVRQILKEMKDSYADRLDEKRILNSELSKKRREIRAKMREHTVVKK